MDRRDNIANLWYFLLVDECDFLELQKASGRVCSGEMIQTLANASKDVDAPIYDLNRHAAHSLNAVQFTFCSESFQLEERLKAFLQQEVSFFLLFLDVATLHGLPYLQCDFAHCQGTV